MNYGDACIQLARLIESDRFSHIEEKGLAIQVFIDAMDEGDEPVIALALAKCLGDVTKA